MTLRHRKWVVLAATLLMPLGGYPMSYPRSAAAVLSVNQDAPKIEVSGTVELRGGNAAQLTTARVHGTPAGRDKNGHIKISDNSMDVATPSKEGKYVLSLEKQQLWLLEAKAEGFETAAVFVSGSAVVDFVLVPRAAAK